MSAADDKGGTARSTGASKDRRLLVIDDELEFREIVRKVAASVGFEVKAVATGKEFKESYAAFRPTVIVLDIVMPDIDGIELVQWLGDQKCEASILLISGYNPLYPKTAKVLAEAKGLGTMTTLAKPIQLSALRAALRDALG